MECRGNQRAINLVQMLLERNHQEIFQYKNPLICVCVQKNCSNRKPYTVPGNHRYISKTMVGRRLLFLFLNSMNFIGEDILFSSDVYIVSLLFSDLFRSTLNTPPILNCVIYMAVSLLSDFLIALQLSFHILKIVHLFDEGLTRYLKLLQRDSSQSFVLSYSAVSKQNFSCIAFLSQWFLLDQRKGGSFLNHLLYKCVYKYVILL